MKPFFTVLALCALLLAACDQVQPLLGVSTPPSTLLPQPSVTQFAPVLPPVNVTPTEPGKTILRVWVPPRFDPDSGNLAGELLKKRLNDFTQQHPGIQLEVRVKALSGIGGLLDSLVTTSAAAPLAMPDLVALSREDLEAAALKGLLHTYAGSTDIQNGPDWYDYARQLAQIQNSVYGLPFAGDVTLVVYRPESIPVPPADWSALLESQAPLIFAAGDPDSIFTLTLYQAREGAVQDSQGQPHLDTARLEEVLNFFREARNLGVMPEWLTQLEDDQEAWDSFLGGAANQVFSWSSNFLSSGSSDLAITSTPTPGAASFTLARGWVWALSSPDEDRLQLGKQLAAFLAESPFMAAWTQASGYLPPRPSALEAWNATPYQPILAGISRSARLQPSEDTLIILGAPLKQATITILTGESEPASAARTAADSLIKP
jgi:ABC-type glycerol-3-phosphate transport system substrate-binding protein